jgi:DNA-binding CsgD family transcriptional regulator
VRNHIRHILRAFNAHSRLEALAIARRSNDAPDQ